MQKNPVPFPAALHADGLKALVFIPGFPKEAEGPYSISRRG
jgi:hypothetical protein